MIVCNLIHDTYTHAYTRSLCVHIFITNESCACVLAWLCVIFMILCYIRESIHPINLLINDLNKLDEMPRIFMMNSNNSGNGFVCTILRMACGNVVILFISCGHLDLVCQRAGVHVWRDTSLQDDQTQTHKPCK